MSKVKILVKKGEYRHTYSYNIVDKLVKEGWKHVVSVTGWNMGVEFE